MYYDVLMKLKRIKDITCKISVGFLRCDHVFFSFFFRRLAARHSDQEPGDSRISTVEFRMSNPCMFIATEPVPVWPAFPEPWHWKSILRWKFCLWVNYFDIFWCQVASLIKIAMVYFKGSRLLCHVSIRRLLPFQGHKMIRQETVRCWVCARPWIIAWIGKINVWKDTHKLEDHWSIPAEWSLNKLSTETNWNNASMRDTIL